MLTDIFRLTACDKKRPTVACDKKLFHQRKSLDRDQLEKGVRVAFGESDIAVYLDNYNVESAAC